MTYFRVFRLWVQDNRDQVEFKDFGDFPAARFYANSIVNEEGRVWIEKRTPGQRPIVIDGKGDAA